MKRSNSTFGTQLVSAGVLLLSAAACSPQVPAETIARPKAKQVSILEEVQAIAEELPEPPKAVVSRPGVVMMTGRLGDPVNDLAGLRKFVPAPSGFGKDILDNPRGVVRVVFGSLGGQIKLDRPIDIALFSPDAQLPPAVSFQLHEFPRTRRQLDSDFSFTKAADGSLEVMPKPGAARAGVMAKANLSCGVYSSGLADAHHLVCSEDSHARALAGWYLARVASQAPIRPGIHVEMHESFIQFSANNERSRLEREASSNSHYDKGQRLGSRFVMDAFEDMQSIGMDFVSDSSGVQAGLEIGFRSARSPFSLGILGSGTVSSAIPLEFFRIPSDADLGFYFPGASRDLMRSAADDFWAKVAAAELDGSLNDLWRQFIPKVSKMMLTGGPSIFAHGPALLGPRPDLDVNDPAEAFRKARILLADWNLIGVFEPIDTWTAAVRNLLKKPTMFMKRSAAELARPYEDQKIRTLESTEEVPISPAEGLPPGSVHIAIKHAPNSLYRFRGPPPLDGPYAQHFYIAGSKSMTWIVFSDNETLARNKLVEVIKTSAPGLAARKDLAPLRNMPTSGIGFANAASLAALDANRETLLGLAEGIRTKRFLTSDGGGTDPIFFSLVSKRTAGGNALRVQAHGNDAIMQAFVAWFQMRPKH